AAFSFVTRPVSIVQTITERPRRMFAFVGTVANVKEDVVQVTTTFRYQIQFAGTDTFRIAVPAVVSAGRSADTPGSSGDAPGPSRDGSDWSWEPPGPPVSFSKGAVHSHGPGG
ncbi:MAG: hypothetical protein KKE86_05445, partial [Planctomycetes bacterium]|nr:hypothetical protein [Planctomycetota bacterium]